MKTSELTGAALDWAVAKAVEKTSGFYTSENIQYSTDWSQGGPIIEREKISVGDASHFDDYGSKQDYMAIKGFPEDNNEFRGRADTPLIAAMRCFVASKLGADIDIPKELL